MREDLESGEVAALQARTVIGRLFVWLTVKDRSTGDPASFGIWNGEQNVSADVVDPLTLDSETRTFAGAGALVAIGTISLIADLTVRTVDVTLSQVMDVTQTILRTYEPRNAPVQIFAGYFDPATRALIADAKAVFVGTVDTVDFDTPAEGGEGGITLHCVSTTRELTRANPDVRSHESQQKRASGDDFFHDTSVAASWNVPWGEADPMHQNRPS